LSHSSFYFVVAIATLNTCSLCFQIGSQINTIDSSNKKSLIDGELNSKNMDDSDKCEIKITTRGVCTVNSEIIRPKIVVKYMKESVQNTGKVSHYKNMYLERFKKNDNILILDDIESKRFNNHKSLDEQKGNDLVDQFLAHFKLDFGDKIDPILIEKMGEFQFENWGNILKRFITHTTK